MNLRSVCGWVLRSSLAVLTLAIPCAGQVYHLRPPSEAIPETLFGMHIHRAQTTTPWPSIPFGVSRLWDTLTTWADLEPAKGKWNFSNLDKQVALAEEHHVRVQLSLAVSPTWASARPSESPNFRPGGTAEPKNIEDWRDYVRTVATRYKGRIHDWELWNEPNLKQFYTGSVETLVTLAKETQQILKEVDPSNVLISPSAEGTAGVPWLEKFLAAGGGRYVDIIGFHFYVTPGGPEAMLPMIQKVRAAMDANGVGGKPLYDTETGWFIQNSANDVKADGSFIPISSGEAVGYVARTYVLAWAAGVTRLNWYDWDSTTMALAEDGGKTRKPAAYAYNIAEKWLIGAKMTNCDSDASNTWVCQITRDGGYHGYIVWNSQGPKKFFVAGSWNAQVKQDLGGNTSSAKGNESIEIGIQPILLENKAP
jgi:hypothetical protein